MPSKILNFSLSVFGENLRYYYGLSFGSVQNFLTFCNISVSTKDIYLLRVCVPYPKSNPCYRGRQFKMLFFFRIMPLFQLRLCILFQTPHSHVFAPVCGALVSLWHKVKVSFKFHKPNGGFYRNISNIYHTLLFRRKNSFVISLFMTTVEFL